MITVTSKAIDKIKDILAEENNPKLKVRMFVQGGGCSGFQYGFTIDEELNEDDFVIEGTDETVVTDSMSMQYLVGATVNYKEDLTGSQFVIENPNAQSTCGCGSSFSV
jgi:iron-sulfur cluster insertion protein